MRKGAQTNEIGDLPSRPTQLDGRRGSPAHLPACSPRLSRSSAQRVKSNRARLFTLITLNSANGSKPRPPGARGSLPLAPGSSLPSRRGIALRPAARALTGTFPGRAGSRPGPAPGPA